MDTNNEASWDKRIADHEASGQTRKAWCTAHHVSADQLKYQIYKRRRQGLGTLATPTFRSVKLTDQVEERGSLWVQVGEVRIWVHAGFDPKLLRDVVTALES